MAVVQVKAALGKLVDKVSQLMWQKRAGVLLALITACSQNEVGELRLGKAVISAYEQGFTDTRTGVLSKVGNPSQKGLSMSKLLATFFFGC